VKSSIYFRNSCNVAACIGRVPNIWNCSAFVCRLRNFAPFNAMILHLQRPGLRFAASEFDWKTCFRRNVREGAHPLIILWPFGPIALVYDLEDTEGLPLPRSLRGRKVSGARLCLQTDSISCTINPVVDESPDGHDRGVASKANLLPLDLQIPFPTFH
jgi:hypothetical protein